jgi:hypothetical protein
VKRPTLLLVAGAAAVLLVFWLFAHWEAQIAGRDQATIAAAQQWLKAGAARRAERAALLAQAQTSALRAAALAREARRHAAGDSLLNAGLDRATTAVDSLPIVLAQRDSARAAVASWADAFAALTVARVADSTRADRAEAALAEGERHLTGVVEIADCHLLGIGFLPRCLSRTASLVVGGLVGAGAAVVALR